SSTLLLWTQIVGKTRLAYSPMTNHWWQVALSITARGLGTSPIPYGDRVFDVEFDFIDHQLVMRSSDGRVELMGLSDDRSVADFYAEYADKLQPLGVALRLWPMAVEIPERVHLDQDARPRRYDADWANRYFRALVQADRLLKEFRAGFVGKVS